MAKSKFRGSNLYLNQQSLCSDMRWQFKRFWENCTSHEAILSWRAVNVFNKERYQRLTEYYQAKVLQTFELLSNQLQDRLFWTHVIPDTSTRWLSRVDLHESMYGPRISEVVNSRGAHCYVLSIEGYDSGSRFTIVPWDSVQLDLDLVAGFVSRAELDIIRNGYNVRRYWPGYHMNGQRYLAYEARETHLLGEANVQEVSVT